MSESFVRTTQDAKNEATPHILYAGDKSPSLYFRPLCPHHQWDIEDLDDYSFYHTYFNHVWANLRRNQTVV